MTKQERDHMETMLELVTNFSKVFIRDMSDDELEKVYRDRVGERDEVWYGKNQR